MRVGTRKEETKAPLRLRQRTMMAYFSSSNSATVLECSLRVSISTTTNTTILFSINKITLSIYLFITQRDTYTIII